MKSSYTGEFNFTKYLEKVVDAETILYTGRVIAVRGLEVESEGPRSVIGEMCTIKLRDGTMLYAEVVGLDEVAVEVVLVVVVGLMVVVAFVVAFAMMLFVAFAIAVTVADTVTELAVELVELVDKEKADLYLHLSYSSELKQQYVQHH